MRYFPQISSFKSLILPLATVAFLLPHTGQTTEANVWQELECRVRLTGASTADTPHEWLGQFDAITTRITDPTSESDKAAAISELQVAIAQYFGVGGPSLLTEPTRWQRFRGAATAIARQEAFATERMGAFQTWLENFGASLVIQGRRAFLETRAQPTAFGVVNEILPPELLLRLLATTGAEVLLQGPGAVREHRVGQLIVDVLTLGSNNTRVVDRTVYNLNPNGQVTESQTSTRIEAPQENPIAAPAASTSGDTPPPAQPAVTGGTVRPRTTTLVGPRAPTVEQPSGTTPTAASPAAAQSITHTQVFGTPAAVTRAATPAQGTSTQTSTPAPAVAATAAQQAATPPPLPPRGEQLSLPFSNPTANNNANPVGNDLPLSSPQADIVRPGTPAGRSSRIRRRPVPATPAIRRIPVRRQQGSPTISLTEADIDTNQAQTVVARDAMHSPTLPPPARDDGRPSIVDQFDLSATDSAAPEIEIVDDGEGPSIDWNGRNFGGAPDAPGGTDPTHAALAAAITGAPAAPATTSTTESLAVPGSAQPPANPPAGAPVAPAPATPETPAATTNATTLLDALVPVGREILTDLFGGDAPVAGAAAADPSPTLVSVLRGDTPAGGWGIPVPSAAAERAAAPASGAQTAPFGTAAAAHSGAGVTWIGVPAIPHYLRQHAGWYTPVRTDSDAFGAGSAATQRPAGPVSFVPPGSPEAVPGRQGSLAGALAAPGAAQPPQSATPQVATATEPAAQTPASSSAAAPLAQPGDPAATSANTGEVVIPALLVHAAPGGPAPDAEAPVAPVSAAPPTPAAATPARRPSPRMDPNDPNTVTMAATARIQVLTESTAALANNVKGLAQAIGSHPLGVLPGTGVNIPFQHFLRSYRVLTSTVALTHSNLPGTRTAVDAFTHELVQTLRAVQQRNPNLSLTALLTTVVGGLTIADHSGNATITAVDARAPEVFSALLAELNRHNPNVGALPRQALDWTGEPHPEGTLPSDPFYQQLSNTVRGLLLKTTVLAHPNANRTATAVVQNYPDFLNPSIGAEAMGLSERHPLRAVSSTLAAIHARGTEENAPTALTATQPELATAALDYVLEHLNQRPVEYPLALNPAVGFPTADDYNAIVEALVRRWTFQTHADLLRASDQALREQGSWWARARSRLARWFGRGQNTAPGGLSLRQVLEWRDSFAHSYSAIWARILAERAGNDSTNGQNDPALANDAIRTKLAALIQKLTPTQPRP